MRSARSVYEEQATATRVRLTFYSFDNDGFSGEVDGSHPHFGKIVGCQTAKAFGGAAGSFTITIKKPLETAIVHDTNVPGTGVAQSWTRLWQDPEGVYVLIQWVCDGVVIDDMLGIIDTISENTMRQGAGERAETYTIVGRDFGKIFEQTQIFINIYDQEATVGVAGIFQRLQTDIVGAPGSFIEALVEAWIGNYEHSTQPWRVPPGLGGGGFYQMLRRRIGCKDEAIDGFYADATLMAPDQDGKNLWSLLQEFSNGLMNELWVDMGPAEGQPANALSGLVPTIYMRRKPFKTRNDHQRWDQLIEHDLRLSDVNMRNVAKGGPAHRFNYWILDVAGRQGVEVQAVLQQAGNANGEPGSIPIWDLNSIEKHGLRPWRQGTQYLPISSRERGTQFAQLAGNWLRRLHDWYVIAPMELSGTIKTTRVRPEIRIGQRAKEFRSEGPIHYYVEGVANAWVYGGAGSTTLTLTRGEYEDEDLLGAVYQRRQQRTSQADRCFVEAGEGDELINQIAAGCEFQVPMMSVIDASGELSGDGLIGPDVRLGGLVSEGAIQNGSEEDLSSLLMDESISPSEADAERAYNGQPQQTGTEQGGRPSTNESTTDQTLLDQDALESGEPIDVADDLAGIDFDSNDPLEGL